jgi:MFS family permease
MARPQITVGGLATDFEAGVVSLLTRRLLPFLFLLYIVAYLDRMNVGFAALQMQEQLGFNDVVYGRAAGMFFLGYFVFQVPSNLILERLGARRWIVVLMVTWGIISSSLVFVTTPRSFYILRFCLGLAEAGFFPGIVLYLSNWFPIETRARAFAWFMTAQPVSGIVGGPISGALLGLHAKGRLAGWQWLFLIEGLPAILLGAVGAFCFVRRSRNGPLVNKRAARLAAQHSRTATTRETAGTPGACPHQQECLDPGLRVGGPEYLRVWRYFVVSHADP